MKNIRDGKSYSTNLAYSLPEYLKNGYEFDDIVHYKICLRLIQVLATRSDLEYRIGVATALEVRASGINYDLAPCVAVCRDPRWGRTYESFSENSEIVRYRGNHLKDIQTATLLCREETR